MNGSGLPVTGNTPVTAAMFSAAWNASIPVSAPATRRPYGSRDPIAMRSPAYSRITNAATTDIFLTGLAIVLTVAYICGLLFRPRGQLLGLGIDSVVVVLLYAIGLAGLFVIA